MRYIGTLLIVLMAISGYSQKKPEFLEKSNQKWVDSVLNSLSLDEKIGQFLMPRGNTGGRGYEPEKVKAWVRDYKIGGIVFFAGQPTVQARLANELQAMSKVPMLVGVDMEWGLAMRLDSTVRFPFQMSLGAMQGNDDLIYRMGVEVGKQAKRMGIHVNYAPVVDINNNPKNPVISFRSFGEDKYNVSNKALAYMKGMQTQNLLVSAKHFPGHGDTGVDSHYDLPVIAHSKEHLRNMELFPFKYLVDNGISGIMTAHLNIPAFEPKEGLASTFSTKIITDLLKKEMGFQGLIFTDAMDMKGAVKNFKPGEAIVEAFLAGNDIMETFEDVPSAFNAMKNAVETKRISMKLLDERVRKILMAKSWVGLDNYKPVKIEGLIEDLNTIESDFLNRTFAEKILIAIDDKNLPVKDLTKPTVVISIGAEGKTHFQNMAVNYVSADLVSLNKNSAIEELTSKITDNQNIIVGLHLGNNRPGANYGFEPYMESYLAELAKKENVVLVLFGNPYVLGKIGNITDFKSVIMANQATKYIEEAAAMAVFGANDINGRLPVTVNENFKIGNGKWVAKIGRLSYGTPEMVGLDSKVLEARVDSVLNLGIKEKAYPGAVIEIAKDGRVIYQKPYGFHTYEDAAKGGNNANVTPTFEATNQAEAMDSKAYTNVTRRALPEIKRVKGAVDVNDVYDLASVTKITTSALAAMQLMSEGKFDLNQNFGTYYPAFKGSNKENLTYKDMLTHRAGLKAWIPFWMNCVDTVATVNKALALYPELDKEMVKDTLPQKFFARLFKKAPVTKVNIEKTLASNKNLWNKALNAKSITWKDGIFSSTKTNEYNVEIADTLFMSQDRVTYIFNQIKESPVNPSQGYVYSDLHYYTYPKMVENLTGQNWEDYLNKTYSALGANSLVYNPRRFFSLDRIVPTELDTTFRKTVIHGRVHDEGAGMIGGVSGHAGLFGNANDLTKLMQMYLQNGTYGGQTFIKPEVVKEATSYQFADEKNRRGIAFDKLDFNKAAQNGPMLASAKSYGHSGYTGTFTWVDPEYNLVYVFLSNRVYPTRDNVKISTLNLRTAVGDEIIKTIQGK